MIVNSDKEVMIGKENVLIVGTIKNDEFNEVFKQGVSNHYIHAICEISSRRFLINGSSQVYLLQREGNSFKVLYELPFSNALSIVKINETKVLVASEEGLYFLNPDTKEVQLIVEQWNLKRVQLVKNFDLEHFPYALMDVYESTYFLVDLKEGQLFELCHEDSSSHYIGQVKFIMEEPDEIILNVQGKIRKLKLQPALIEAMRLRHLR